MRFSQNRKIFSIDPEKPDLRIIQKAASILKSGGLVIFPTESVYGIAVLYGCEQAVKKLAKIKERPATQPFTVHISDKKIIAKMSCVIDTNADTLIEKFWPGPLTLVLPLSSGKSKIGFRLPDNKVALRLIHESGGAILAPSANRKSQKSPVNANEAFKRIGEDVDMVLDAGETLYRNDSTIVDLSENKITILRHGAIREDEILKTIREANFG